MGKDTFLEGFTPSFVGLLEFILDGLEELAMSIGFYFHVASVNKG